MVLRADDAAIWQHVVHVAGTLRRHQNWVIYRDNGAGNWWHNGSLPGSTTIMVRTSTAMCWAALTNTRTQPSNEIDTAIDQMMWDMVRTVPA
jgi:hypothetical protein